MKNIRTEIAIWCQVFAFLAIWIAILAISRQDLRIGWEALKRIPEAIGLYSMFHVTFTTWGWRLRLFQGWLVPLPDLQGTWAGVLQTTWKERRADAPLRPIPILMVVKQTFSTISCVMYSKESASFSHTAQLAEEQEHGAVRLSFNYTNRSLAVLRDQSQIHDGAAILTLARGAPLTLAGEYWTTRKTTGDLQLVFRSKRIEDGRSLDTI